MKTFYTSRRSQWRSWLMENFQREQEIWFVFPLKKSGEESLSYNDAVEEALCFGWIDSTARALDSLHGVRRFTPRRKGSGYSRPNIERLIWLESRNLIHHTVREEVLPIIRSPYIFPEDILATLEFVRNNDYYPSFTDKLSYLVYGFCHGHYFLDGNKRIALTIGVFFLLQNGYYYAAQNFMEKVEAIIYHVASGKVDRELLNEVLICVVNGFDYSDELKIDLAHRISDE